MNKIENGDWPNPQSPIPNPQAPKLINLNMKKFKIKKMYKNKKLNIRR